MTHQQTPTLHKHVFFVGFMGSGKSSVAAALACDTCLPLVDLDALIVQQAKRSIPEIFRDQGQEAFRDLESAQLQALVHEAVSLVACGGGIVQRPENIKLMRACGFVVCLDIDFDEAAKRIGTDPDRPLFANLEQARALALARTSLYHQTAHYCIDTTRLSLDQVVKSVRDVLVANNILCL